MRTRTLPWLILAGALVAFAGLATAFPAAAKPAMQETEKKCLECHGDSSLSVTLPSGEKLSLYVSQEQLDHSVHSTKGIECEACHNDIKDYPHPDLKYKTRRELSLNYYLTCEKCHSANYQKTQDSMHAQVAREGNENAPVCTDCHGHHDTRTPDEPRSLISETCGKCHDDILTTYKGSIHGSALINEGNNDVPVCTDCHGVHNIQDSRTDQFRAESPEMCAHCHSDQELMDKYNLSSDVYSIYKRSWHGVDISVYKARWGAVWHNSAVCTDCHSTDNVHDIRKTGDPASSVNPANMLATCRKCHPDAGPNWVDAWTGHNEISLQRTPSLFYVNQFYNSFSPFVLWVCVIYVLLQIVHSVVDRVRSSLS